MLSGKYSIQSKRAVFNNQPQTELIYILGSTLNRKQKPKIYFYIKLMKTMNKINSSTNLTWITCALFRPQPKLNPQQTNWGMNIVCYKQAWLNDYY